MAAKPSFSHSGRDAWDQSHGSAAGKGDAPRHKLEKFRKNYDEIKWGPKFKGRFRKSYGPAKPVRFSDLADIPTTFSGNSDR